METQFEYGSRIGMFRTLDLFKKYKYARAQLGQGNYTDM